VAGGTARDGSSDSDSGWGGVAGAAGFSARGTREMGAGVGAPFVIDIGFGGGGFGSNAVGCWTGPGSGVSSTSECLPVVHGGMSRNSSKVSTRGLQHFQPTTGISGRPHNNRSGL